jgi:hypothetical protein
MDSTILNGIKKDCDTIQSRIGVDKDLILINYTDFDLESTLESSNIETNNNNLNIKGLSDIKLYEDAVLNIFEGTEYSVVPTVTPVALENGLFNYKHSITFTVYSKLSKDRETLEKLSNSRVIAVTRDKSTGLYELFGMYLGLRVSGIERSYTGSQNSNFYSVTIATPEIYVLSEPYLSKLSVALNGFTNIIPMPDGSMTDITDLNDDIVKVIGTNITTLTLTNNYVAGTPKIYFNGQRIHKGSSTYDYIEIGTNQIILNFELVPASIIIVDYKINT